MHRIIIPARDHAAKVNSKQHDPSSFRTAMDKARIGGELPGKAETIHMTESHSMPPQHVGLFWEKLRKLCNTVTVGGETIFRDPILCTIVHDTTSSYTWDTPVEAREAFLESCKEVSQFDRLDHANFLLDFGFEDSIELDFPGHCPPEVREELEQITLLRKSHCCEHAATHFDCPRGQRSAKPQWKTKVSLFPTGLTQDVATVDVKLGKTNEYKKRANVHAHKRYHVNHEIFRTRRKAHQPFD